MFQLRVKNKRKEKVYTWAEDVEDEEKLGQVGF